jgi:large subunit ribosomal protein L18
MAIKSKRVKLSPRERRKKGLRKNIYGTLGKPRVSVFKSRQHIYAQIICDVEGKTLVSASTLDKQVKDLLPEVETKDLQSETKSLKSAAGGKAVGLVLADRAKAKKIEGVVFDRNGYLYHGRVKALADGARKGGLKF